MLGVQPDSRELEDVCSCALLSPPSTELGEIETVSVHQVIRGVFKDLFLQETFISAGKVCRVKLMPYRIAGKFGEEFNLPNWRGILKNAKLKVANFEIYTLNGMRPRIFVVARDQNLRH